MKSLDELRALKEKAKKDLEARDEKSGYRVVVGMATCGISAGARPVLQAMLEEVQNQDLQNVTVGQTGCIGMCQNEPIVEVYPPEGEKFTYIHMDADKAKAVIEQHIKNDNPVTAYMLSK